MVSASARSQATRYRHRAVFKRTSSAARRRAPASVAPAAPAMASSSFSGADSGADANGDDYVDEEILITSDGALSDQQQPHKMMPLMIPDHFTHAPLVHDALVTDTSEMQDETAEMCLAAIFPAGSDAAGSDVDSSVSASASVSDVPHNAFGVPRLDRARHARFLHKSLEPLPSAFVGYDPSRPWLLFWCLNGLSMLGEDVGVYRARLADTARSMQNASGGFGGGHGQSSHLATTYAVVMALAIVGGEACYEAVDRRALWRWLCSLKQPDGGFQMSVGGEEDVRGAYCAAVIISILNLPLNLTTDSPAWTPEKPTLFAGLANYVQRCQTYEGGISAQPGSEAHGGYAFCALGCLSILDSPDRSIPRYLNVPRLVSWLASRQYAPEGGFSGRTNKLVDGCYSHWVGDCWPLVEACLQRSTTATTTTTTAAPSPSPLQSLFSREGLIRYILCCCQDQTKRGGLRDKPGRMSDPYHTCYVLSGLSSAQHKWDLVDRPVVEAAEASTDKDEPAAVYSEPVWKASPFPFLEAEGVQVFGEEDRVATVHPVYTIPADRVDQIQAYFRAKAGF